MHEGDHMSIMSTLKKPTPESPRWGEVTGAGDGQGVILDRRSRSRHAQEAGILQAEWHCIVAWILV